MELFFSIILILCGLYWFLLCVGTVATKTAPDYKISATGFGLLAFYICLYIAERIN